MSFASTTRFLGYNVVCAGVWTWLWQRWQYEELPGQNFPLEVLLEGQPGQPDAGQILVGYCLYLAYYQPNDEKRITCSQNGRSKTRLHHLYSPLNLDIYVVA